MASSPNLSPGGAGGRWTQEARSSGEGRQPPGFSSGPGAAENEGARPWSTLEFSVAQSKCFPPRVMCLAVACDDSNREQEISHTCKWVTLRVTGNKTPQESIKSELRTEV